MRGEVRFTQHLEICSEFGLSDILLFQECAFMLLKLQCVALACVAHLVRATSCTPKGGGFDPW